MRNAVAGSLVAILLSACVAEAPKAIPGAMPADGEITATVNGKPLTTRSVEAVARRMPPEQVKRMREDPKQWQSLVDRVALGQVLWEEAIAAGIANDPAMLDTVQMTVREVIAGELVQRKGAEAITEDKLLAAYEKKAVQYGRPQVKARHILVKDKALADELKAKADAGGDFAALATEHSTDKGSAAKGGDLGWFDQSRMVKEFADAAFAATAGQIVGPVESKFGFHVIKVEEKRDKTPFEDVKDDLAVQIRREATEAFINEKKGSLQVLRPGETPPAVGAVGAAPLGSGHDGDWDFSAPAGSGS